MQASYLQDDVNTRGPESSNEPWTPPLSLLVVCPLPLFLVFVLIRKVRKMAPISLMANSAATVAYFLVIGYISADKWNNACCRFFCLTCPALSFIGVLSIICN